MIAASELLVGEEYLGVNYSKDRDNKAFGQASGASIDRPLSGDFQALFLQTGNDSEWTATTQGSKLTHFHLADKKKNEEWKEI